MKPIKLKLAEGQGTVIIEDHDAIESVSRGSRDVVKVGIRGHMTFYVTDYPGLMPSLLRMMAEAEDRRDKMMNEAAELIK